MDLDSRMTQDELDKILEAHKKWLNGDKDGVRANLHGTFLRNVNLYNANLSDADLSCAYLCGVDLSHVCLRGADLHGAYLNGIDFNHVDLSYTNLKYATLTRTNLIYANLSGADLTGVDLRHADIKGSNLSSAKGLLSVIDYIKLHFERVDDGYIVYKTFGREYTPPENWEIKPGSVLTENVNFDRAEDCGCGINVAPLEWVRVVYGGEIWRCLIRWEWLAGVCVPYNTDGKIRCERVELLEVVQ